MPLDQGIQNMPGTSVADSRLPAGTAVNSNYVSVQTGEEFSSEFLRDRLAPKMVPAGLPVVQNRDIGVGFNNDNDHVTKKRAPVGLSIVPNRDMAVGFTNDHERITPKGAPTGLSIFPPREIGIGFNYDHERVTPKGAPAGLSIAPNREIAVGFNYDHEHITPKGAPPALLVPNREMGVVFNNDHDHINPNGAPTGLPMFFSREVGVGFTYDHDRVTPKGAHPGLSIVPNREMGFGFSNNHDRLTPKGAPTGLSMVPSRDMGFGFSNNHDRLTPKGPPPGLTIVPPREIGFGFNNDNDRVTPKGVPTGLPAVQNQEIGIGYNNDHDRQMGYEDLTRILGLRRMDSECGSDVSEFASAKAGPPEVEYYSLVDRGRGHIDDVANSQGPWEANCLLNFDQANLGSRVPITIPQSPRSYYPFEAGTNDGSQSGKLRILCSFGGKILPRPSDGKLRYVGGETRIVSIRKNISWEELVNKTSGICIQPHTIKYQLPGEDLDALISVSSDEDLQNMMEEYEGIEKSAGSQRLRIFLIPASEAENRSSGTLQQTSPDYEYVVAINGILDPSPQKMSAEQLMTDATKSGATSDHALNFQRDSPSCLHQGESKDGPSVWQAAQFTKDFLNTSSSPAQSTSFSPKLAENRNAGSGIMQSHEDNLWIHSVESNSSFITAQLPADHSIGKSSEQGYESHFLGRQGSRDFVTPSGTDGDHSHFNGKISLAQGKAMHRERHMSVADSRAFMLGSNDSIDSHHCLTHAYSDSQLQQYVQKSPHCSQEEINPSSPLNFAKLVISASPLDKVRHPQEIVHSGTPEVRNQLVDMETSGPHKRVDLMIPAYSEPLDGHQYLEGGSNVANERSHSGAEDHGSKLYEGMRDQTALPTDAQVLQVQHQLASTTVNALSSAIDVPTQKHGYQPGDTLCDLLEINKSVEAQQSHFQHQQLDLLSGLAGDSLVPQGQTSVACHQEKTSLKKLLMDSSIACPSKVHNIDPHSSDQSTKDASAFGEESLLHPSNKADQSIKKLEKLEDGLSGQVLAKDNEVSQAEFLNTHKQNLEPFVVTENVPDCLSQAVDFSSAFAPHAEEAVIRGWQQPNVAEGDGIDAEIECEDAKTQYTHKDDSMGDAMMAEIEAGLYGLQIIKNADLEELRELGSGTYGTVYHGKWRGTDVAIKRIKKSCFSGRSSEQERLTRDFWREAQILSKLHHPNVVAFYGVVPDGAGGTLATVTEYMVNGSLRNVLLKKDRSLDRRKRLIIAMDAAFGMEYLHSKNIVHFDLKCDNLLVNMRDPQRPICKVGDFGLSRIKRNTLVSGGVRGTLPWMAPELLNGSSSKVSEKVDVFSFGIAMWEILTGEEPYANMHCGAIIGGILKNTLRPPVPERCDAEWRKLMEECWSADPDARPSFTEITDRLRSMSAALQSRGHQPQKSVG